MQARNEEELVRGRLIPTHRAQVRADVMILGDRLSAGSRALVVAGVVAAPFVIAGYLGLTLLIVLPLRALRAMFPRSEPSALPWSGAAEADCW